MIELNLILKAANVSIGTAGFWTLLVVTVVDDISKTAIAPIGPAGSWKLLVAVFGLWSVGETRAVNSLRYRGKVEIEAFVETHAPH